MALISGDSTTYYGVRRTEGRLETVDNADGGFGIGSVSKVFTATLLARLVEAERLQLDDRVNVVYPYAFADSIAFTYRQLASHTSGLPRLPNNMPELFLNPGNPYGAYTPERLEEYLRDGLTVAPDGNGGYSNLGFGLLGYTLGAKVDTEGYTASLHARVLDPLGMTATSVGPDSLRAPRVPGWNTDGSRASYWGFTEAMAGAGAIVSTPRDMVKFLRAQMDPAFTAGTLTREPVSRTDERRAVGLGWQLLLTREDGRQIYWHNGGVGGYRAFVALDVAGRRGVVLLTNALLTTDVVDRTGFQLLNSLD